MRNLLLKKQTHISLESLWEVPLWLKKAFIHFAAALCPTFQVGWYLRPSALEQGQSSYEDKNIPSPTVIRTPWTRLGSHQRVVERQLVIMCLNQNWWPWKKQTYIDNHKYNHIYFLSIPSPSYRQESCDFPTRHQACERHDLLCWQQRWQNIAMENHHFS